MLAAGTGMTTDADFVVTSAADWSALFANNSAALANKIVEIASPITTAVALANHDFIAAGGPVTIRSANPAAFLSHLDFYNLVRGVNFSGLVFQLLGWPKAHRSCIEFNTGTYDELRFINGTTFRHGYGPNLTNLDTAADLPEYERISNVRTATTTSAAYPLTWKDPTATSGMIEFFNRGPNPVRVAVGGADVQATTDSQLVAAGARHRFTGLNPSANPHFAVLSTAGISEVNARAEVGLLQYLGRAFFSGGAANIQSIEIRNCLFRDLGDGIKGVGTPTRLVVMDNDLDRIYNDIISAAPAPEGSARIMRNIASIPFSRSGIAENLNGDASDPHGDMIQMFGNGSGTISNVRVAGNRMRATALRNGVTQQGAFISDNDISPSYADFTFVSNTFLGGSTNQLAIGEGASLYPTRDVLIYGATIVSYSNVANPAPAVGIATDQPGSIYLGKSIYAQLLGQNQPQQDSNLRLTAENAASVFPNLGNLAMATTRAEIELALMAGADGVGLGAAATSDAVDWTTSDPEAVIRWENVPSGAHWNDLTSQPLGTLVELPLRKVLNKRPDQTVAVAAGTEWRSVAADGVTQTQAWTAAPGTIQPGQFIQIRTTTSGTSGGRVTASVTINGFVQNVSLKTVELPTMVLVQGTTAGYFVDPANVPAGTTRITFRAKIRLPAGFTVHNLFTQESTGCDLQIRNSQGALNATVEDGTAAKTLFDAAVGPETNRLLANTWHDVVFEVDQAAQEVRCTVDGVTRITPFTSPGNGVFQVGREVSFLASTAGANPVPPGTQFAELSVDFNGVRHKTISNDAATANADPWKRGGSFNN